jgi:hypothetical protein
MEAAAISNGVPGNNAAVYFLSRRKRRAGEE